MAAAPSQQKLLWLDMEMTGLDVEKEVPIEVAAIITDFGFSELETYHAVIRQPKEILDRMDAWNQQHHGESGLLAAIPNGKQLIDVDRELSQLIDRHFIGELAVLAGNSIGQDRLFLNKYFSETQKRLHYRMLDVTSLKIVMNSFYQRKFEKKNAHRALDDIRESIAELKFYMSFIN